MSSGFERISESKRAFRKKLMGSPIAEKLRIVEEMAERALATRKDTSSPLPDQPWSIPNHWRWSHMGDVATIVGGSTPKTDRADYFGGDVPWITPADLSGYAEKKISRGKRNITQAGLENSGARLMPAGTILFSSRAPIGYVAIAANPVATNQGFKSFILQEGLLPDFVYYYLQRAKELAVALASGTTFLEISGKNAARLPVPIPPLIEQRRIVEEIEKEFTRLDAGVAALRRVQANLKRFRAAVLKAGCEGRLVPTEAEFVKNGKQKTKIETGEVLLARILAERRRRSFGRGKYEEPATPNTSDLPTLPEFWTWATVEQLLRNDSGLGYGILKPGTEDPAGVPMIRVMDIGDGKLSGTEIVRVEPKLSEEFSRTVLESGDILLAVMATVGRCTVVPEHLVGANVNRALAVIKPTRLVPSKFLELAIRSPRVQQLFQTNKIGSAQARINLSDLRTYCLPLPPLAEQARIVAEAERRLSMIEELEAAVSCNLQRARRLRQSILQKAFSGGM